MHTTNLVSRDIASSETIRLYYASLVIFGALFAPTLLIAYKHGKPGMLCWPIFVGSFGLRLMADAYHITRRHDAEEYDAITIITSTGIIATLSLTLLGMIYEGLNLVSLPSSRRGRKIVLGVTHFVITASTGMTGLGGVPDSTASGGVKNENLNRLGCSVAVLAMCGVLVWLYFSGRRIFPFSQVTDQFANYQAAKRLLMAAGAGSIIMLIRLTYNLVYAFNQTPSLDPVTGSFATRLVLVFGTQLLIALVVIAGGWLSKDARPPPLLKPLDGSIGMSSSSHLV
ncbi:hypothetical protein EDB80DRAFT_748067 [Ilyonectria destructans]|nr:hypothetical protein EDB80DRAFT_748067 [Ilyonectria destructans]